MDLSDLRIIQVVGERSEHVEALLKRTVESSEVRMQT